MEELSSIYFNTLRSRSQICYSKICITVQLHLSMLEQRYSADSTPCLGNGKLGCRHME